MSAHPPIDASDPHAGGTDGERPVVVGVSEDQFGPVLDTSIRLARALDAALAFVVVNVGRYTVVYHDDGTVTSASNDSDASQERIERFPEHIEHAIAEALEGTGLTWSVHALAGGAGQELMRFGDAVDAQMFVVGAREPGFRGSFREFLNGSVATQLAHSQSRPVVVVPWQDDSL